MKFITPTYVNATIFVAALLLNNNSNAAHLRRTTSTSTSTSSFLNETSAPTAISTDFLPEPTLLSGHYCDVCKHNLLSNNITSIYVEGLNKIYEDRHDVALEECLLISCRGGPEDEEDEFDNEAAELLAEMITKIKSPMVNLVNIQFVDTDIGDKGVIALVEALSGVDIPIVNEISFQNNKIGEHGASAIASAILGIESLILLELSGNTIGDEGAIAVAKVITDLLDLTTLGLGRNQITDKGIDALAEAIEKVESMEYLALNGNLITEKGATVLADAIAVSPSSFWMITMQENMICDPNVIQEWTDASESINLYLEDQNCDTRNRQLWGAQRLN